MLDCYSASLNRSLFPDDFHHRNSRQFTTPHIFRIIPVPENEVQASAPIALLHRTMPLYPEKTKDPQTEQPLPDVFIASSLRRPQRVRWPSRNPTLPSDAAEIAQSNARCLKWVCAMR